MKIITLFVLLPSLILGKAALDSGTESWNSIDDSFTLKPNSNNPQDSSQIKTTPRPLSSTPIQPTGIFDQSNVTSTTDSPVDNPIYLPFLLQKLIEDRLNEMEGVQGNDSYQTQLPEKDVKFPEVHLTPPIFIKEKNNDSNTHPLDTSASSEELSGEISTTTDGSITETTTSDSFEVDDDDSKESTDSSNNSSSFFSSPSLTTGNIQPVVKVYAEKYQTYVPTFTEKSINILSNDQVVVDKQDADKNEEPSTTMKYQDIEMPSTPPTSDNNNNMMDHLIFDKPDQSLNQNDQGISDNQDESKPQPHKYLVFLRPSKYGAQLVKTPIDSDIEPTLMTNMIPPNSYMESKSPWNMYTNDKQMSPDNSLKMFPRRETPMMMMTQNYLSAVNQVPNYYQYQYQPRPIPMRNNMMFAMSYPSQAQLPYLNYPIRATQMQTPMYSSALGLSGGDYYYRSPYWNQQIYTSPNNYYDNYRYNSFTNSPRGLFGNGMGSMGLVPPIPNYYAF